MELGDYLLLPFLTKLQTLVVLGRHWLHVYVPSCMSTSCSLLQTSQIPEAPLKFLLMVFSCAGVSFISQLHAYPSTRLPFLFTTVKVKMLVTQSCPTLCDSLDCTLPGSSVHGILQARILEWLAMPSSRGSSQPRN